ncbi:hypothetical protein C5F64_17085 [Photobacterium damselae subsp. damselae]|nr:hypothetical protein C5F64_17085 [Photobacterium damselae subsp. damselae]
MVSPKRTSKASLFFRKTTLEITMSETMRIFLDDGSTGTKIAFIKDDELFTTTIANRAELGLGVQDSSDKNSGTYTVLTDEREVTFTFYPECRALRTANIAYQYGALGVAAIHHALHSLGFSGRELDVCVTLPISEFYTNGRVNKENIKRKIANVKTPVSCEGKKDITIAQVQVYPEGIPASYVKLTENGKSVSDDDVTFLGDLGGTTFDLALFAGSASRIMKCASFPIGMYRTYGAVKNAINTPDCRDSRIESLLLTGQAGNGRFVINRNEVTAQVMAEAKNYIDEFLFGEGRVDRFLLIGGGAELLSEFLSLVDDNNYELIENPTTALVTSIAKIELNKRP